MAGVRGAKPKAGPVRHRVKPVHEWTEVADVPFHGPDLPDGEWSDATLAWWRAVSSMPHCATWRESDWAFAVDTARVREVVMENLPNGLNALTAREKVLGMAADHRRDIRVKYVDPELEQDEPSASADRMLHLAKSG